jgi:hypothetical protein
MTFIGGVGATVKLQSMPFIGPVMQRMGKTVVRETAQKVIIDRSDPRKDLCRQLSLHPTIKRNELLIRDPVKHPEDKPLHDAFIKTFLGGVFTAVVAAPFVFSHPLTAELPEAIQNCLLFGGSAAVGLLAGFTPNIIQAAQAQWTIQALLQADSRDVNTKTVCLKTLAALGYHEASGTRCLDPDDRFDRDLMDKSKLEAALFDFVLNANESTSQIEIMNALDLLANHYKSAYTLFHLHRALFDSVTSPKVVAQLTAQAFVKALQANPCQYKCYLKDTVLLLWDNGHKFTIKDTDLLTIVADLPDAQQEEFRDFYVWLTQLRSPEEENLIRMISRTNVQAPSEKTEEAINKIANQFKAAQTIFQLYSQLRLNPAAAPRFRKMLAKAYVQCVYSNPAKYKAHLKRHGEFDVWDEDYMFRKGSTYQKLVFDLGMEGKAEFKQFYEREIGS